ncbi:MAG: DUF4179 domain-containing protein [Clostridium sp.]
MKERLLDNEIKDMLKAEGTKIPDVVSDRINETLNSLEEIENLKGKKTNNMYKRLKKGAVAAGLMGVMIVGVGVPSYAYMNNIPVKDAVLNFFGIEDGYSKLITDYGISKESNGVRLTIDSSIYDGYQLLINYTVESKESLNEDMSINSEKNRAIVYTGEKTIFKNRAELSFQEEFGEFIDGERKVYSGAILYNVDRRGLSERDTSDNLMENTKIDISKLPDEYTLELSIDSLGNLDGEWGYALKVESEKAKGNVKEVDLNKDLSYIFDRAELTNILITPIRLYLNGYNNVDNQLFDYIVVDNENRVLKKVSGGVNGYDDIATYIGVYDTVGMDTKSVTVIPYNYDKINKKEGVHLNLDRETKLDTGAGRELTITKVYEKDGNTYVHYIPETYINDMIPFHLIDSEGVEHYQYSKYYQESEASKPFGEERYLLFEGELLNKDLKVATYTTIYFDDAFTVDIK